MSTGQGVSIPWSEPQTHRTDIRRLDAINVAAEYDLKTLREFQHNAEVKRSVARMQGDDLAEDLWDWSAELSRMAISFRQYADAVEAAKRPPGKRGRRINYEAIKQANDIVTFAERYTRLRKSGNRLVGQCPVHSDHSPSFVVYAEQGRWWCFGCQQGGDVVDLARLLGVDLVGGS